MTRGHRLRGALPFILAACVLAACTPSSTSTGESPESPAGSPAASAVEATEAPYGPVTDELLTLADCNVSFPKPGSGQFQVYYPDFVGSSGYLCASGSYYDFKVFEEPEVGKLAAGVVKRQKKKCGPVGYAIAYADDWAAETTSIATVASRDVLKALAAKFGGQFFSCDVKRLSGFEQPPKGLAAAAFAIERPCNLEPRNLDKKTGDIWWRCKSSDDFDAFYKSFDPRRRSAALREEMRTSDSDDGYEIVYGADWFVSVDGKTAMSDQWKEVRKDLETLGVASKSRPPVKRTPRGPSWENWEGTFLYRWLKPGEFECSADWCWGIEVDPMLECSDGVYAEVNFLDENGTVVDWSNDTIPVLGSGQAGRLVFGTFEPKPDTAELVTLSCYA